MKKNPKFETDVLQCIANGIDTQAKIIAELNCNSSTLCIHLRKMIAASKIQSQRVGMHNVYSMRIDTRYNDPFGLAQPTKNTNTFYLPPRRQHSMDERIAA